MATNRYLPFLLIAAVAVADATAGAVIYRSKHSRVLALAATTAADNRGGKPGAVPAHAHGSENAPVIIEEFGDFQCPPCQALATTLRKFENEFPGQLRVLFRQYPLDMHKHAHLAALGAEAAAVQGHFWEMHERLYRGQEEWSKAPDLHPFLQTYAREIGLNLSQFTRDLENGPAEGRLKLDRERATSLGVNATPTVFVNTKLVQPDGRTTDGLRHTIQEALDGKKTP